MPPRRLPFHEVIRKLKTAGFGVVSQHGSHVKLRRQGEDGVWTTIVPRHRVIAIGLLRAILRQTHLTWEEFDEL